MNTNISQNAKNKPVGKKPRRANLVDAVILLCILVAAAALVYSFVSRLNSGGDTQLRYVLEVPLLQSDMCEKVAKDDGVYAFESAKPLGTVSAVSSAQAYHSGTDSSGNKVSSEIQGYSVLYITVEATASAGDTGYLVNGESVNVGRELEIRLPGLYCTAECISVEELS